MLYNKDLQEEIVLIRYYNVMFYLKFRAGIDELKKNIIIERVDSGERLNMRGIYRWCKNQQVSMGMRFSYRKDLCIRANIWNLYSYWRFKMEVWRDDF